MKKEDWFIAGMLVVTILLIFILGTLAGRASKNVAPIELIHKNKAKQRVCVEALYCQHECERLLNSTCCTILACASGTEVLWN